MLPKTERMTKQDFKVFRPKGVFRGTYVDIAAIPATNTRFACVISKKRMSHAVDRNRARRKVYSFLVENKPSTPHLIVMYPKVGILTGDRTRILEEIRQSFATL